MKIRFFSQPHDGTLGEYLLKHLESATKSTAECLIVSAFAKKAGILRLMPHIGNVTKSGSQLIAVVGIDHKGTSREAIELLHGLTPNLYVFHSTRPDVTFHPKLYCFHFPKIAFAYVGSCNLTAGGLFTNIETFTQIEYDLPAETTSFGRLKKLSSPFSDASQQTVIKVDSSNLSQLLARLPTESSIAAATQAKTGGGNSGLSTLFGPGTFKKAPPVSGKAGNPKAATSSKTTPTQGQTPHSSAPLLGQIQGGWKRLSNHDVHIKQSPGQIVIPLSLAPIFPALGPKKTTPKGAKQSEVAVRVRYIDSDVVKIANGRFILYEPAPTHARSNIEHRFTFLDHSINPDGLNAGDILVFETLTSDPDESLFNVYRVKPGTPEYQYLISVNSAGFGTLGP
jgi:HKD family nuclease